MPLQGQVRELHLRLRSTGVGVASARLPAEGSPGREAEPDGAPGPPGGKA